MVVYICGPQLLDSHTGSWKVVARICRVQNLGFETWASGFGLRDCRRPKGVLGCPLQRGRYVRGP